MLKKMVFGQIEHVDTNFATEGNAAYSVASINAFIADRPAQTVTASFTNSGTGFMLMGCSYG